MEGFALVIPLLSPFPFLLKRGSGEEGLRFCTVLFQRAGKGEEELQATSAELEMGVLFFSHFL